MKTIELEIYYQGQWQALAEIEVKSPSKSSLSATQFVYDLEYYFKNAQWEGSKGLCAASESLELNAVRRSFSTWPSFLLDLIPQGAARAAVCKKEGIADNQENDLVILTRGGINPVGNIRIKSEVELYARDSEKGFTTEDLEEKNEEFLDYAEKFGAITVGASGVQGMAPKFLINQAKDLSWHCDGALKDEYIEKSWLVKFKRGRGSEDQIILEAEKVYMDIAMEVGINANRGLKFRNEVLYIPRFDRISDGRKTIRYGLESLSSIMGHIQFGLSEKHEDVLAAIQRVSSDSQKDILEYIRRDFLNIVMGNTDNHTRNTAFLKTSESSIRLSPLFDFAPMVMDSALIPRVCKWTEEQAYIPKFSSIAETLKTLGFIEEQIKIFFSDIEVNFLKLPELFKKYKMNPEVTKRATRKYKPFMEALIEYKQSKK